MAYIMYGVPVVNFLSEDIGLINGVPVPNAVSYDTRMQLSHEFNKAYENNDESQGFHQFYAEWTEQSVCAFGVKLSEFSVNEAFIPLSGLVLKANDEAKEKYQELLNALSPEYQLFFEKCGDPHVFIFSGEF